MNAIRHAEIDERDGRVCKRLVDRAASVKTGALGEPLRLLALARRDHDRGRRRTPQPVDVGGMHAPPAARACLREEARPDDRNLHHAPPPTSAASRAQYAGRSLTAEVTRNPTRIAVHGPSPAGTTD